MQLNWEPIVMMIALFNAALVLALPTDVSEDMTERGQAMVSVYVKANLSSLFGWQLAGSRMTETELWANCYDMTPKWSALGLSPQFIKGPLCNSSAPDSKPVDTVSYIDGYTTSVFISQLLSSFNNTDAFAYVCNHIGFNMVSSFAINDLTVVQAVCAAAGLQTKLRPEKSLPWASDGAVRAARNTASILFTIIWAAGATSDSQLNAACARAPDYVSYLDMEQLNGTLVQSTLCSIKTPIAASHARDALKTWMSRYFTTVLENIIHGEGWLEWLCKNIDPDMLDLAGLFGAGIQSQVCADSKSYPASDGRWERTHLNQGHFEPGEHSRRYFDIF